MRTRLALCCALALLLLATATAKAEFRRGPLTVPQKPEGMRHLLWVGRKALVREALPPPLLAAAKNELAAGNSILIAGHTDTVGPRLLNESLSLEYARDVANRLQADLGAPAWRFFLMGEGEAEMKPEGGVDVYAFTPAAAQKLPPLHPVNILSPTPSGPAGGQLLALLDSEVGEIALSRVEEGVTWVWDVANPKPIFRSPFPARVTNLAVGGSFRDGVFSLEGTWTAAPENRALALKVESLEPGAARLSGRLPAGYENLVVWAGGIPYTASVSGGRFDLMVARYAADLPVYAQAQDPKGNTVAGPLLRLPGPAEATPRLVAVLVWKGQGVDLDLHGWRSEGHTQPSDPDPRLSPQGATGMRVIFDGDTRYSASALWVDDPAGVEIEVRCFTDLGAGAEATLYLIENPDDPVLRKGKILGPRRLSGKPLEERWPALSLKGS